VTNLLDVARIDRGLFDLDLEPVDLAELAREAAAVVGSATHKVVVRASIGVVVNGDRQRLRQCLDNLITNAVSHSPSGAPVSVFIEQVESGGQVSGQLQVIDEGPGVPQEVMQHLFERFASGRAKSGGVGLGLYLADRIVRAHGGKIEVDSSPGKGTRFTLCLPLYRSAVAPASENVVR